MPDETKPKIQIPLVIAEIISEINNSDPEAFPPQDEKQPNEQLIGTLHDEFAKKTWSTLSFYRREAAHSAVDSKFDSNQVNQANRLMQKSDLLNELFWWVVRNKHEFSSAHSIGVRKGWIIVESAPVNPLDQLRGFLGGM